MSADTLPRPERPVDELFAPHVWMVVVGYNNAADSIECLQSIQRSTYNRLSLIYVDNGSREEEFEQVVDAVDGVSVLRHPENIGVARGFNSGMAHAMSQGADYVGMVNNDTTFDPDAIGILVQAMLKHPETGVVVPKKLYYDHPNVIWSAGARYRKNPPAIILKKTKGEDDGRYDGEPLPDYTPYCVCLFSRKVLDDVGMLDPVYHFFYEDYDHCVRARAAGYDVRFEPTARIWHKISKTLKVGNKSEFYRVYGRSHAIFCTKFPNDPYVSNRHSLRYLLMRTLYEGGVSGLRGFRTGYRQGLQESVAPPPRWNEVNEPAMQTGP